MAREAAKLSDMVTIFSPSKISLFPVSNFTLSRRNVLEVTQATQPPGAPLPGQPVPQLQGQQPAIPGAGVRANPQNPQVQGGNNPLGFIGRYMGIPPRPDNQGANRQILLNNNNQGQQGGPGGIYINYQVQYQFPRTNDPNQQAGQQQQTQPLPPYPGFPGPEGVWQPWPQLDNGGENAPMEQSIDTVYAADINGEHSQPGDTSRMDIAPPTNNAGSNSGTAPAHEGRNVSPRQAAAQAALNRLGQKSTRENKPEGNTSNVDLKQTEQLLPGPSSGRTTSTTASNNYPPKFIPLTDYRSLGSTPRVHHVSQQTGNPYLARNGQHPSRPVTSIPRAASSTFYGSTSGSTSRLRQNPDYISSSNLPLNLNEEQLANLDKLTRESIDERLRILEGVSTSVYRCIDDLMKLRSALPPLDVPSDSRAVSDASTNQAPTVTQSQFAPQTGSEATGKDVSHGKQKMQEAQPEGVDSPDPASADSSA